MIFGPLKVVARIVGVLASLAVLYLAITFIQIWLTGHQHSTQRAQAILVFGTTEDNGRPSIELRTRLDQALTLYHEGRASWVVVTGGKLPGDAYTEAGVSATYLIARGVPPSRVVKGGGNDTWQNVATVIDSMKRDGLSTVLTVTDPFHEYRAMAIASAQGLSPQASPVRSSPTIGGSLWRYYLKETLAVGVGRVVGYGTLSRWTTRYKVLGTVWQLTGTLG